MLKQIDEFIRMNQAGLVLELCERFYAENVIMMNNGSVFASSMKEAYEKQAGFIGKVKEFDVKLISKVIEANMSELTFHYKMTSENLTITEFTGKHIQTWHNQKIIREEYQSIE
ncbi:MAG: hypothetical protein V7750_10390 [Sneathiella sp.]